MALVSGNLVVASALIARNVHESCELRASAAPILTAKVRSDRHAGVQGHAAVRASSAGTCPGRESVVATRCFAEGHRSIWGKGETANGRTTDSGWSTGHGTRARSSNGDRQYLAGVERGAYLFSSGHRHGAKRGSRTCSSPAVEKIIVRRGSAEFYLSTLRKCR